jgi:hypothetical protein
MLLKIALGDVLWCWAEKVAGLEIQPKVITMTTQDVKKDAYDLDKQPPST